MLLYKKKDNLKHFSAKVTLFRIFSTPLAMAAVALLVFSSNPSASNASGSDKNTYPGISPNAVQDLSPKLAQVCLDFSAKGRRLVEKNTCSNAGMMSEWLWIGDDTGYRNQQIKVTAWGGAEVCLRFSAVGKRRREMDWVCSSNGMPSPQLWIGDDTGYRRQKIQILTNSRQKACLRFTHTGRRGTLESDLVCSANSIESPWLDIGDDTGYRNQKLKLFIEGGIY